MIEKEQLIEVGKLVKLHGLNGEMTAAVTDAVFDDVFQRMARGRKKGEPYLVLEIDGIFVPFFVSDYRFRTETTMLISFDGIGSQERAAEFCGLTLYFDRRCFTRREAEDYDRAVEEDAGLVGYTIIDTRLGTIGRVTDIDAQTANVLFIVAPTPSASVPSPAELMIPAADELIVSIDDAARTITMNLPQGLINLEEAEEE